MKLIQDYIKKYPDFIVSHETFHNRLTLYTTRGEVITVRKVDSKYQVFLTTASQDDFYIDRYELTPVDTIILLQTYLTNIPIA